MLPDRFDAQGRPLDGPASSRSSSHRRGGEFEYRSPRGAEGTNVRGAWGVAGTDAETVERIVRDVTGVLEGRGSWMGLIGGILSGSLLKGPAGGSSSSGGGGDGGGGEGQGRIADRDESRSRRRRRDDDRDESRSRRRGEDDRDESRSSRRRREDERGESSRRAEDRTTRGRGRDSYDDDDDDYDGHRKRRRGRSEDPGRRGVGRAQTWG